MDLAILDLAKRANAGFDLILLDPGTNAPLDATLRVLGRDSDFFRGALRAQTSKRARDAKKTGVRQLDSEVAEDAAIELLAGCVTGWHDLELDGQALLHNKANAEMIVRRFPWIREQLDAAIADRGRLFTTTENAEAANV